MILFYFTKSLQLEEVKLTTDSKKNCCLCVLQEWLPLKAFACWFEHLDTVVDLSSTM